MSQASVFWFFFTPYVWGWATRRSYNKYLIASLLVKLHCERCIYCSVTFLPHLNLHWNAELKKVEWKKDRIFICIQLQNRGLQNTIITILLARSKNVGIGWERLKKKLSNRLKLLLSFSKIGAAARRRGRWERGRTGRPLLSRPRGERCESPRLKSLSFATTQHCTVLIVNPIWDEIHIYCANPMDQVLLFYRHLVIYIFHKKARDHLVYIENIGNLKDFNYIRKIHTRAFAAKRWILFITSKNSMEWTNILWSCLI